MSTLDQLGDNMVGMLTLQAKKIQEQATTIEALRADALRYRWLRAALDTELATERSALAHDRELRDALTAERDRLRDALIACRPHVMADLTRYERLAERFSGPSRVALDEESARIAAILETIDAAAKGQG